MINIKSDSRKIKKGDTFIAVKCEINDGHQYIEKAIAIDFPIFLHRFIFIILC